ncbi:unnamed protein product [Phaedon cochleariae]|uniref:Uncharacterized protein n=1 Tax=Phaedon cochleariae TaxID=80249 RepID=A0A9P0GRA0_PHACE|nr:unnamed protein product [Phaedon cochleariae]
MGCQWPGMAKDLMRFPAFRNTLQRCAAALAPHGVDLMDIVTNTSPKTFDSITNCFCGIGAMEIALTDLLTSLGIVPDGIAGHSLGEVGCAYADGQITVEQAALLAYARGYASQNSQIPKGQMAAVGLTKEELQSQLPEEVFIACQNSKTSFTISGLEEPTKAFVAKLTSKGVFARLVPSAGIAFHTKHVAEAGELLLEFCKKVLTDPKPRSSKWVSSSVPSNKKDLPWTKMNCAEYHHNNFCSTVLFDQVYQHIPENAIVVEVAPHGLLQAILKRELGKECTSISLANRLNEDNEQFFLAAVGKIFNAGGAPKLRSLYDKVSFPVSRKTAMLAPMVKWDHGISWFTPLWKNEDGFGREVTVNLSNEKYSLLSGHNIDGRVLMPAVGYLELIWETVAELQLKKMEELPIIFENVKFKRATVLAHGEDVKFLVNIMKQTGNFEIFEGGSVVLTGTLRCPKDVSTQFSYNEVDVSPQNNYPLMKLDDVYKECNLRRYLYKDKFRGLVECDIHGHQGKLEWKGSFTSFLDTMLHLTIVKETSRDTMLPVSMGQVIIDPVKHLELVGSQPEVPVIFDQDLNVLRSGGIEINRAESHRAPRRHHTHDQPHLETFEFISYESQHEQDFDTCLRTALQIVIQNKLGLKKEIRICELLDTTKKETVLTEKIKEIINFQPMTNAQYSTSEPGAITGNYDVIVVNENTANCESLATNLTSEGFFLYTGKTTLGNASLQIIFQGLSSEDNVYLLRPYYEFPENYAVVNIRNSDFEWVDKLKKLAKSEEPKVVYLFAQGDQINGIIGLVKCLLTEPSIVTYRSVFIDQQTDIFSIDDEFYADQLRKNLTFNVLRNRSWGTFVHLPLTPVPNRDVENASITVLTPGDLSSLRWIERPLQEKSHEDSELVHVFYSALNFKDVMIASGKLQSNATFTPTAPEVTIGLEYAGVTSSGARVMGLIGYDGLSLQVRSDPGFSWKIPDSWSLRDAATVPCVYATCYYAMLIRGQMLPGESILIHAGTGGIGMAAISIALSMGCKVFTTVGNQEKREFIKRLFPELEDKNIGNSRNRSFEKMIMSNTRGKGVDLVLNSLSADLFQASLRCIGRQGRFLEIGKVDFFNGTPIDSHMFLKNCSFHGVLLDDLFDCHSAIKRSVQRYLTEGMNSGVVKPLPSTVFDETEVETAFRFLSSGKHKGKVLVQLRKEDPDTLKSPTRTIEAIPKVYFDPNKSYVIIGGLGGIGLELTDWLIKRGATKILLNSKRTVSTGHQAYCLRKWSQHKQVTVKVNTEDTTQLEGATRLVCEAKKLGPVGGVFNMALALRDALMTNQTQDSFEEAFKPKLRSGRNLDLATRQLCKQLDHFVVFSSIAAGRGNIGQSNYAMANSALERLCEQRRGEGLPAVAVQYGPVGEVGVLARVMQNVEDIIESYEMAPQSTTSCFQAMETMMLKEQAVGSSSVLSFKEAEGANSSTRSAADAVAHILGVNNIELVDKTLTLLQLGLDSLMVAEIKQTLYRHYQLDYSPDQIRDLTFDKLIALSEDPTAPEEAPTTNSPIPSENTSLTYLLPKELVIKINGRNGYKRNIFMFHPIEGNVDISKPLAEQLKATVYGLQATRTCDFETISETARFYLQEVRNVQPKGPYCLCGYSYGSLVSLEVGLQLEKAGENVEMVSLDGSPEYVRHTLDHGFQRMGGSVEKSKMAIVGSFFQFFQSTKQNEIDEILKRSSSWSDKLQGVGELLAKETGHEASDIAASADLFYKRCHAGFYYEPQTTFKGRVLLVRREDNPFLMSDNYDLQKVCQQPVKVVKIQGDHKTILLGENTRIVANIINDTCLSN